MGLLAQREVDAAGYAAAQAISDTRKSLTVARGYATGSVSLTSGTKAVTGAGIPANALIRFIMATPGGTLGVCYQPTGVGTTGGFTVTSLQTTGATQAADTSTLTWEASWPLFHADQTPQFSSNTSAFPAVSNLTSTAATAVDLPSTILLSNQMLSILSTHGASATSHLVADTTLAAALLLLTQAVDQPSVNTLLNGLKAAFNSHLTQAGVHVYNDTLNTNATTAASSLATAIALANVLQGQLNAHLSSAPTGESVTFLNP